MELEQNRIDFDTFYEISDHKINKNDLNDVKASLHSLSSTLEETAKDVVVLKGDFGKKVKKDLEEEEKEEEPKLTPE